MQSPTPYRWLTIYELTDDKGAHNMARYTEEHIQTADLELNVA